MPGEFFSASIYPEFNLSDIPDKSTFPASTSTYQATSDKSIFFRDYVELSSNFWEEIKKVKHTLLFDLMASKSIHILWQQTHTHKHMCTHAPTHAWTLHKHAHTERYFIKL